jgi:quercetin dioxygenase-like cupin family protein
VQWYEFSADPGGVLESEAHQRGSVESLTVSGGELEFEVGGAIEQARAGETLRYRCDRAHTIRNVSHEPASATMVRILKAAAME